MRSSLIAALLVGLLLFPAILPAGDVPVMRAENLGDTTPFTQPQLLAVANLDQRISTTTNTADRQLDRHPDLLLFLDHRLGGLAPGQAGRDLSLLRHR